MPFGYSRKVFSHPAVEYIPILPVIVKQIHQPLPIHTAQILVLKGDENPELLPMKNHLTNFSLQTGSELGILLLNVEHETIKYRGNYVTIVATPTAGKHQTLKVPTRYFYKSDLVFQVVDPEGNVLSYKVVNVPITR